MEVVAEKQAERQRHQEAREKYGVACNSCHYRKVRCDMGKCGIPCTNCKSRGRSSECREHQKKKRLDQRSVAHFPRQLRPITRRSQRSATPAASDEDNEPGNLADLFNREEVRSASIGHRGRMCFVGSDASNFSYLVRQSIRGPPRPRVYHFGTRQFHRRHTAHDVHNVPEDALRREHKSVEARLLEAYFERVNPGWPIVDEEYFMKQYAEDGFQDPLPLPLLNAILLVGAHTLAAQDKSLRPLVAVFFRRAKVLIECRFEQDRTLYVQAALLMTWHSDGHEDILANTWHWIGFACRIAIGHGMHRDATNSRMLECHKRTWTRLWWVLFQFDTILSASYGRPQVINLDEADVPGLAAHHFQGIRNPKIDFVLQHTKLCEIISRVMRHRWALRSSVEARIAASKEADDALAQFTIALPPSCHLSFSDLDPWMATLHLTYNNFIVLLHRPAPTESAHDEVSAACTDLSLCGSSTVLIASILETLRERTTLSSLWLYSVHTLFTATIHAGMELNSNNAIVAAKAHKTFESLMASLKVLSQNWRFAGNVLRLFEQRQSSEPPTAKDYSTGTGPPLDPRGRDGVTINEFSLRPVGPIHNGGVTTESADYAEAPQTLPWKDGVSHINDGIGGLSDVRPSPQAMISCDSAVMNYASLPVSPSLEQFLSGMDFNVLDY